MIARRALLQAMGIGSVTMPFGDSKTQGFQNQLLIRLAVANSRINSHGMFFYSGTPANGNLIASLGVTIGGTDPYGNTYLAGDTFYANDGFGSYIQINGSLAVLGNTAFPTVATGAGSLNMQPNGSLLIKVGGTGGGLQLNQDGTVQLLTGRVLVASTSTGAEEGWNNAVLTNPPFVAGGTTPRYRLRPTNEVTLDGAVNLNAAAAAFTTMFTMSAGHIPANAHDYVTKSTLSGLNPGAGVMPATVHVTNAGQVQIAVNGINGNFVVLDGITIPLD